MKAKHRKALPKNEETSWLERRIRESMPSQTINKSQSITENIVNDSEAAVEARICKLEFQPLQLL